MIALLAGSVASAGDCAVEVAPERWTAELTAAERGYGALDAEGFADHLDAATLDLPCLSTVLAPADAARYHALVGLRLFGAGDEQGASASFASARASDPGWDLPEGVVPAAHEVRTLIASASPGGAAPVPAARGVTLWFDGARGEQRPERRPTVLQVAGEDGHVLIGAYLSPADPLPAYPRAAPVPVVPVPAPAPVPAAVSTAPVPVAPDDDRGPRWGWLAGAGVAGGGAAVLYGLGASSAARFAGPLDPEVDRAALDAMRSRTNGLVLGSVVAGGLAAASATLFVVKL